MSESVVSSQSAAPPVASPREPMHLGKAIVQALSEAGVTVVAGMPGGLMGPIFSWLHDHPTIRLFSAYEESIATTMAEAYGRLTGIPMVVMGQGAWVAGNAGQGLVEAHLGSSPIVVITEMTDGGDSSHLAPYQSGTGDYGTWNAAESLRAVTKRVMVSHYPLQAVQHVQLALKHALTGEQGPVAVVLHSNAFGRISPPDVARLYPTQNYLPGRSTWHDEPALRRAAAALAEAERPVIVAGNGVRLASAYEALEAAAHALAAPVATTSGGKGVFDEHHPQSIGVLGEFGHARANRTLSNADVVLAVGTKLGANDVGGNTWRLIDPARQTLIQVDVEPLNVSWTVPAAHALVGDAGYMLNELMVLVQASPARQRDAGHAYASDEPRSTSAVPTPAAGANAEGLDPREVIEVLNGALPNDVTVTCDAGENRLFMQHWFRSRGRGKYLQPAASGGMGYAIPAAMAATLAGPGSPAVAVCGDGGFDMSLHALRNAIEQQLPICVVVLNNGALGWVLHGMGKRAVAARRTGARPHDVARSFGCESTEVRDLAELTAAVSRIATIRGPMLIEVPISLETSFLDVRRMSGLP